MKPTRSIGWIGLVLAMTSLGCGGKIAKPRDPVHTGGAPAAVETADALRAAAIANPREPYWPFRLAEMSVAAGDAAEAEAPLKAALDADANYTPALALLSKVYFDEKRHAEAIQLLTDAELAFPGGRDGFPAELLAGLALHYDAIGELERAQEILTRARVSRSTGSALAYVALRGAAPTGSAKLAEAALDADKSAVTLNNYGVSRLLAGDPERAKRAFLDALEKDADLPGPYYNLAIVERFYFLRHAEAAKWFRAYWSRSHEDPDGLAEVLLAKQEPSEDTRVASADSGASNPTNTPPARAGR